MPVAETSALELTCSGHGKNGRILINGQDISHHVNAVTLNVDVEGLPTAQINMLAHDGLNARLQASVAIVLKMIPGYVLIEEPQEDGTVRYRTEKEPCR